MNISDEKKQEYRKVLLPAVEAAKAYDGTQAASELVLSQAIKAEEWLKAQFPGSHPSDVERDIRLRDGKPDTPSFQEILGQCITRLSKILPAVNDVRGVANYLGIPVRETDAVLLPPERTTEGWRLSGNGTNTSPPKYEQRFGALVLALNEVGIYTDDLIVTVGRLFENQVRTISYALIEIPRMRAEILVSNEVGEATYVSKIQRGLAGYTDLSKADLIELPGVMKVICRTDWIKDVLDCLRSQEILPKINVRDMEEVRVALQARFSPGQFIALTQNERASLKIKGIGLKAMAAVFQYPGNPRDAKYEALEFAALVWGEESPELRAPLTKSRADKTLRDSLGSDRSKWKEAFEAAGYSAKQILALPPSKMVSFEFAGLGYVALVGLTTGTNSKSPKYGDRIAMVSALWGEDHPDVREVVSRVREMSRILAELGADKAKWRTAFAERGITAIEFLESTTEQRAKFQIGGLGLGKIARRIGGMPNPLRGAAAAIEFASLLWDPEHPKVAEALSKSRADAKLQTELGTDLEKWRAAIKGAGLTPEKFVKMAAPERVSFKVAGLRLTPIAHLLGLDKEPCHSFAHQMEFGAKLWGEAHPVIAPVLARIRAEGNLQATLGTDREKWRVALEGAGFSAARVAAFSCTEWNTFQFAGLGLAAIFSRLKIDGEHGSRCGQLKFAATLWGEDHDLIQKPRLQIQAVRKERSALGGDPLKVRAALESKGITLKALLGFTMAELQDVEFAGMGLRAIAGYLGIKGTIIGNPPNFHRLLSTLWGAEHPELAPIIKTAAEHQKLLQENGSDPEKWQRTLEAAGYDVHRFLALSKEERREFKCAGLGMRAFARILGVQGDQLGSPAAHVNLAAAIWKNHEAILTKSDFVVFNRQAELGSDIEKWRTALEADGFTPKRLLQMSEDERKSAVCAGLSFRSIGHVCGIEFDALSNLPSFLEFIAAVWGEESPELKRKLSKSRKDVMLLGKLGTDAEKWKGELERRGMTAEKFIALNTEERAAIRIGGIAMRAIASRLGLSNYSSTLENSLNLAAVIWGEEHAAVQAARSEPRARSAELERLGNDPAKWRALFEAAGITAGSFLRMSTNDKAKLKIAGVGLGFIGSCFGTEANPIGSQVSQLALATAIWGSDNPDITVVSKKREADVSRLRELGSDPAKWRAQLESQGYSAKRFVNLLQHERAKLEVAGIAMTKISRQLGVAGNPLSQTSDHLELSGVIWGSEHPDINLLLKESRQSIKLLTKLGDDRALWRAEIESRGYSAESFVGLPSNVRSSFKIGGLTLRSIARKLKLEGNPDSTTADHHELCATLWGEDNVAVKPLIEKSRADAALAKELGADVGKWRNALEARGIGSRELTSLSRKGAEEFQLAGFGLWRIARMLGLDKNPVAKRAALNELAAIIWPPAD